jgi:hypothetical protein
LSWVESSTQGHETSDRTPRGSRWSQAEGPEVDGIPDPAALRRSRPTWRTMTLIAISEPWHTPRIRSTMLGSLRWRPVTRLFGPTRSPCLVLLGDSSRFSGGKACISAASQGPTEEETPTVSCCRSYGPALTTPAREHGERQSGPRTITGYGAGPSSRRSGAICVGDGDRRSPFPWIGACGICLGTFRSTSQRTSVFAGNVEAGEIVEVGLLETGRPQILLRFTRS